MIKFLLIAVSLFFQATQCLSVTCYRLSLNHIMSYCGLKRIDDDIEDRVYKRICEKIEKYVKNLSEQKRRDVHDVLKSVQLLTGTCLEDSTKHNVNTVQEQDVIVTIDSKNINDTYDDVASAIGEMTHNFLTFTRYLELLVIIDDQKTKNDIQACINKNTNAKNTTTSDNENIVCYIC